MEPMNFGPPDARAPYTNDDEEECARCGNRQAPHGDQEGNTWIGCSFEDCEKWYHQVCIGMSDEEYRRVNANEDAEWFCTEGCRAKHLAQKNERAALQAETAK